MYRLINFINDLQEKHVQINKNKKITSMQTLSNFKIQNLKYFWGH